LLGNWSDDSSNALICIWQNILTNISQTSTSPYLAESQNHNSVRAEKLNIICDYQVLLDESYDKLQITEYQLTIMGNKYKMKISAFKIKFMGMDSNNNQKVKNYIK
jgi:hypothetical protein